MKNIVVLNAVALAMTFLLSKWNSKEAVYVVVYLYEIIISTVLYKYNNKNAKDLYFKSNKWLYVVIVGLLTSNILVVIFHDAVKWLARPFFWMLSISYVLLFLFYSRAFLTGRAKLLECFTMITTIMVVLLISLLAYRYYRLSYSAKYKNNILVYKHYADATYEETVMYHADSSCYVKTINQGDRVITIYYNCYPINVSRIDTMFVNK